MSAKADQSDQEARAVEGAPLSVSTRIGVVVERRPSQNRWIDEVWMPVAVIPGLEAGEPWQVMREADGVRTYLACTLSLSLHRAEVEAYKLNLSETAPKVLIVLSPAETGDMPYTVTLATCAPYEAEGYLMGGGEIVEPVPMPPEIIAWVKRFIDSHYREEPFVKRRRDEAQALVDHKFGKDPIFDRPGRYPAAGAQTGKGEGDER